MYDDPDLLSFNFHSLFIAFSILVRLLNFDLGFGQCVRGAKTVTLFNAHRRKRLFENMSEDDDMQAVMGFSGFGRTVHIHYCRYQL